MITKKILVLNANYELHNLIWLQLKNAGFLVDCVKSVTEFLEHSIKNIYFAYIVDIVALPGESPKWIEIEKRKKNVTLEKILF